MSLCSLFVSSVFVSLALTIHTVLELGKYGAQDLSGQVIAPLLLRELGALTVSLAWSARVAALVCLEAQHFDKREK